MNTATLQAPRSRGKEGYPIHRMAWARYIAQTLSRAAHFDVHDVPRAAKIRRLLESYVKEHGPRGSGFDWGTRIAQENCKSNKLVFLTQFHHMDEHGGYDGWTYHKVIATPLFWGFDVRVSGKDRNGIRDYIGETFHQWLGSEHDHPALIEHLED